jgi:hypothetical protein
MTNLVLADEYLRMSKALPSARNQVSRLQERFTAPIVCICGSTRFKQALLSEEARLTLEGNIVLGVDLWGFHERIDPDEMIKVALDCIHKRKIDLCDWVWVLNVNGYIGDSTRSEIEYAEAHGKPVRYLSQEFPDYIEPRDELLERLRAAEKVVTVALERKRLISDFRASEKELRGGWSERMMIAMQGLGRADDALDAALAAYDAKGGVPHTDTALAVLNKHYPMVAGHVTALQQAGETVAAEHWAEVARDMYEAIEGGTCEGNGCCARCGEAPQNVLDMGGPEGPAPYHKGQRMDGE